MPSLREQTFSLVYTSPQDDAVCDFFIPALKASDTYCRAAGFFSSSALVELSRGLCDLALRGGRVRVITSPRLTDEDVLAVKKGYDMRKVAGEAMVRDFKKPDDFESIERLSFLSELIAAGILDMKIAVMRNADDYPDSIFHAKFGIMTDSDGCKVGFSGSMNETGNGMTASWENITVFTSPEGDAYIKRYEEDFNRLWEGRDGAADVLDMPDAVAGLLEGYRTGEINFDLDKKLLKILSRKESVYFKSPDWLELRPYQADAVNAWKENGYRGIFNMATGTGKTKAAMCALEELYNSKPDEKIFTIIIAPQKHLVDQWADEVRGFGVRPIIGHSDSYKDWKEKFGRKVALRGSNPSEGCLVTTIASFVSKEVQDWIPRIDNLAVVFDEAHHMGSERRLEKLPPNAKYRLALSATIERYKDKSGTEHLREYFGKECIRLSIEDAIGKYLTNYRYHPIPCVYGESDYARFINENVILNEILSNPRSTKKERDKARNQYIEHSFSINATMQSKYDALVDVMGGLPNRSHFLVYCGKVKVDIDGDFDENSQVSFVKALDKASGLIGMNGLGFKISRITYKESADDRRRIIGEFDRGETEGIVAISCLDEGVDIPSIRSAVIMTSSDNPREYIQRRGRVLRLYPGKEWAEIYDMIVIPKRLSLVEPGSDNAGLELKMLAKEIRRMMEFSRISLNPDETGNLLSKISRAYELSVESILEGYGEDQDE